MSSMNSHPLFFCFFWYSPDIQLFVLPVLVNFIRKSSADNRALLCLFIAFLSIKQAYNKRDGLHERTALFGETVDDKRDYGKPVLRKGQLLPQILYVTHSLPASPNHQAQQRRFSGGRWQDLQCRSPVFSRWKRGSLLGHSMWHKFGQLSWMRLIPLPQTKHHNTNPGRFGLSILLQMDDTADGIINIVSLMWKQ